MAINIYGYFMNFFPVLLNCMAQDSLEDVDYKNNFDMCDFAKDNCGWTGHASEVYLSRYMLICGRNGKLIDCILKTRFQDGDTWTPRQIGSINYIDVGFSEHVIKMIHEYEDIYVLATTSLPRSEVPQPVSDIVSVKIPLALHHRCLHYSHLVLGGATLVVAYITDYFEPYDLRHILKAHSSSPVVKFSRSSSILPLGVEFKIVFRAMYNEFTTGLTFVHNISVSDGVCDDCASDEFRCDKNQETECIPLSKLCDFEADCLGEEDEQFCDFTTKSALCNQNSSSTSTVSDNVFADMYKSDVEGGTVYVPRMNLCDDGKYCELNSSNKCSIVCPASCNCSGLSFNCSSHDAPTYATSLVLHDYQASHVTFDNGFSNLKHLTVNNCKMMTLTINQEVLIETLEIRQSNIETVVIDDTKDYLRSVRLIQSTFVEIKLSSKSEHTFELYVDASSIASTIPAILYSVNVKIYNTLSFPYTFHLFECVVLNFSYCDLDRQPSFYHNAITLDLSYNRLKTWRFNHYTKILHLQSNQISTVNFSSDFSASDSQLQYLDLSDNNICCIDKNDFGDLPSILYLKLRNNGLQFIHEKAFSVLSKLVYLDLSDNKLKDLSRNHFLRLTNLKYLYLHNNDNLKVVEGMFDGLINIEYLQVDSYTFCCAQPKAVSKIQCSAPVNEISSCQNLIDTPILSIIIWYIAFLAVFGNVIGPLYRVLVLKPKVVTSFAIYSLNLGLADFLMGVYLYIIAGANLTFSGRYGIEDESWRHSAACTFAGVLATISSEASALFVLCITIDRIFIIRFPFSEFKTNTCIARLISILVWFVSLLLALTPLFGHDYFDGYYSSSGICISLPLSVLRKPGWEYSMIIFVGANFVFFIGILLGQFVIFADVVRMGKEVNSHHKTQNNREINLAKTLIAVAVTDMFCWIPMGVIGFLTFMGIDVTSKVYAWVIVVVLPINSALNPIIYTFSAMLRRRRKNSLSNRLSYSKTKEEKRSGEINRSSLPATRQLSVQSIVTVVK